MTKYKCPFCGNISKTIQGFTDVTEYNGYVISNKGEAEWVEKLDTFKDDVKFECTECNETTNDITDFKMEE